MISTLNSQDSLRSSSPTLFDDQLNRPKSILTACCHCSRKRRSFFNRILSFKAQKRRSSLRKQQLASSQIVANGHLQRANSSPSPEEIYPLRNSPSIPSFSPLDYFHRLNANLDCYSFADIEASSTSSSIVNDPENNRRYLRRSRSKSILSRNLSTGTTTDLSAYSSQSLVRKLLDKAQVLDQYYNEICKKKSRNQSSLSLTSTSSNCKLPVGQTNSLSHQKRSRAWRENVSSVSNSRFDLYVDEDNVLRELIRFNNDIDLILSRLETEGEEQQQQQQTVNDDNQLQSSVHLDHFEQIDDEEIIIESSNLTMRGNVNEINIHLLLSSQIDLVRQTALAKLLKMVRQNCELDQLHDYETLTLSKLNKLPKSTTWKGKRVFGVPLRIHQQTTGHVLPLPITHALQYVRLHAGKCDGLFRKPGVKSKIDRLRAQIETNDDESTIKFEDFQPFVVADVVRQYFRELPECLISPVLTRLLCDLIRNVTQEEQIFAIRYTFLLLPDENREVLESVLRFLLDVSIRSGNSQTTCRSLARIFLPSVFQSYHEIHPSSTRFFWWKRKKEKFDAIQQENERLTLEHCLMTMILNIDLLCRVPQLLSDELHLSSMKKSKRLDDLVRDACEGDFQMKKFISKDSEQFLQRLVTIKFKNVPTQIEGVHLSIHKSNATSHHESEQINLPIWKCSIDIPNNNIKQICQRIVHERHLWDQQFAECRIVEKIDDDKEIVQYVLNLLDSVPVRSFCEFRFLKKIASRSTPDLSGTLIGAVSIDHLQNHFLPGSIGLSHQLYFYVTPSTTQAGFSTVTQLACVDYSGRSSHWYEHVCGFLFAHNLKRLRDTFTNSKVIRV